jgi:hypothetical protein
MHIKLEINAESVEEFDAAVARFAPGRATSGAVSIEPARGPTAAEAETPLDPPATKTRQRKPKDEPAPDAGSSTAPDVSTTSAQIEPETASDEHPMLTPKTLAEVKALGNKKVSELGAGPIQQALIDNFQVKAFGGLDPADYDRAYAILEALK